MIKAVLVATRSGIPIAEWKRKKDTMLPTQLVSAAYLISNTMGMGSISKLESEDFSVVTVSGFYSPDVILISFIEKGWEDVSVPKLKALLFDLEGILPEKIEVVTKDLETAVFKAMSILDKKTNEPSWREYYTLIKNIYNALPKDIIARAEKELMKYIERIKDGFKERPKPRRVVDAGRVVENIVTLCKIGALDKAYHEAIALENVSDPLFRLLGLKIELLVLLSTARIRTMRLENIREEAEKIYKILDDKYRILAEYIIKEIDAYVNARSDDFESFLSQKEADLAFFLFSEEFKNFQNFLPIILFPSNYYASIPIFKTKIGKILTIKLREEGYTYFYERLRVVRTWHDIRQKLYVFKSWEEISDQYTLIRKNCIEAIMAYEKLRKNKIRGIFSKSGYREESALRRILLASAPLLLLIGSILEARRISIKDLKEILIDAYNMIRDYIIKCFDKRVWIDHEVFFNITQGAIHLLSFLLRFFKDEINYNEMLNVSGRLVSKFMDTLFMNFYKGALKEKRFIGQWTAVLHEYANILKQTRTVPSEAIWLPIFLINNFSENEFLSIFNIQEVLRNISFKFNLVASLKFLIDLIRDEEEKKLLAEELYDLAYRLIRYAMDYGIVSLEFLILLCETAKICIKLSSEEKILEFLDKLQSIDYIIATDPEYLPRICFSILMMGEILMSLVERFPHLKGRLLLLKRFEKKVRYSLIVCKHEGLEGELVRLRQSFSAIL